MKTRLTAIALLLSAGALLAKPYTPTPGSTERKAICDAMRTHVRKTMVNLRKMPFLFKVEFLRVDGDYAGFEGFAVNTDGSDIPVDVAGDLVYTTCLKRINGAWKVVADLSGGDVPSDEEVRQIRKRFPADFPASVLPDFWRKRLRPRAEKPN